MPIGVCTSKANRKSASGGNFPYRQNRHCVDELWQWREAARPLIAAGGNKEATRTTLLSP
jgi:hypothetical protein